MPVSANKRKRQRDVPCPCPRLDCRGALRHRETVKRHARDAADGRAALVAGGVAARDDCEEEASGLSGGAVEIPDEGARSEPEEILHAAEILENLREPVSNPAEQDEHDIPCLGEVVMQLCDWWIKNKASAESAKQVWAMCRSMLGRNNLLGEFKTVTMLLRAHRLQTMRKVCTHPMC